MTPDSDNTDPVLLTTPAPVAVRRDEPYIVVFTKFLAWLTAMFLAAAVLVSLINVGADRNQLSNQVDSLTDTLNCRASNTFIVTRASADKQIALAHEMVAIGDFITLYLDVQTGAVSYDAAISRAPEIRNNIEAIKEDLNEAAINLENAVDTVDKALDSCTKD